MSFFRGAGIFLVLFTMFTALVSGELDYKYFFVSLRCACCFKIQRANELDQQLIKTTTRQSTGNKMEKIVIFGATGRSGRPLLQQALDTGYKVIAVARAPERLDEFQRWVFKLFVSLYLDR